MALVGAIDCIQAGLVKGWFFNESDQSQKEIVIYAGGVLVAEGVANRHRNDLKEAGFGDGECSFSLLVQPDSELIAGKALQLRTKSDERIEHGVFNAPSLDDSHVCELEYVKERCLTFKIESQSRKTIHLYLYHNNTGVMSKQVELEVGTNAVFFQLPQHFHSIIQGFFRLAIDVAPYFIWQHEIRFLPSCYSYEVGHKAEEFLGLQPGEIIREVNKLERLQEFIIEKSRLACDLKQPYREPESRIAVVVHEKGPVDLELLLMSIISGRGNYHYEFWLHVTALDNINPEFSKVDFVSLHQLESEKFYCGFTQSQTDFVLNIERVACFSDDAIEQAVNSLNYFNAEYAIINDVGLQGEPNIAFPENKAGDYFRHPKLALAKSAEGTGLSNLLLTRDMWNEICGLGLPNKDFENAKSLLDILKAKSVKSVFTPQSVFFAERSSHQTKLSNKPNGSSSSQKVVLMVDMTTPTPDQDAGSYAAVQELELIRSLGYQVKFIPCDMLYKGNYTRSLQGTGVEVSYAPFYPSAGDAICQNMEHVEAIYMTRYHVAEQFVDFFKENHPNIPLIFNLADLHFLREMRSAVAQRDKEQLEIAKLTQKRELAVIQKVDVTLSYNMAEEAVITSHLTEYVNIVKCPWVLSYRSSGLEFSQRHGIAFLGGYAHQPNVEAVDYFVTSIFPLLQKKYPELQVYFYGSKMPERFKDIQSESLHFVGFVENLSDVYSKHRVFIAPLISGAGVKGKVLEAAAYGIPSVLSPIAIEGTGLTDSISASVATSPDEWVEKIARLYRDQKHWSKLSNTSRALAKQLYGWESARDQMLKIFESVGLDKKS